MASLEFSNANPRESRDKAVGFARARPQGIRQKSFRHAPLDRSRPTLRLLRIMPLLSEQGLIQVELEHHVLPEQAQNDNNSNGDSDGHESSDDELHVSPLKSPDVVYFCLSYTWGDGLKDHKIDINGQSHLIHRNLWMYLDTAWRQMKSDRMRAIKRHVWNYSSGGTIWLEDTGATQAPLIWIDAICIDQDNLLEKNHQVQQMGHIYASARLVIIWLDNGCEAALKKCFKEAGGDERPLFGGGWSVVDPSIATAEYWSRAWITQEVLLARRSVISVTSGLYDLQDSLWLLEEALRSTTQSASHDFLTRLWTYMLEMHVEHQVPSLLYALDRFHAARLCADVRDRIYSLLALCRPGKGIEVDYKVSRQQLLYQVAASCDHQPCLCGLSILSKTLELGPTEDDNVLCLMVELQTCTLGVENGRCRQCRDFFPQSWSVHEGTWVCLRQACENMRGHLRLSSKARDEEDDDHETGILMHSKVEYTFSPFASIELLEINVSPTIKRPEGLFRVWRFTSKSLFLWMWHANDQGTTCARLCDSSGAGKDPTNGKMALELLKTDPSPKH